jgi:dolichol kinase
MISEFFIGFSILIGYFVLCVIGLLLVRKFFNVQSERFRKTLHIVLLFSLLILIYAFKTWWISALVSIIFTIIVFPLLSFGERFKGYSELLTERKKGEIKLSLILVFGMFTVIISICWGWLNDKILAIASIYAWGFGDGVAALVGKRFGKNFLEGKLIEGRKSVEGTVAMFVVSFLSVFIILLIRGGLPWHGYILISIVTAAVCAVVELYTLNGYDTVTCPFAAAAIMLPLLWLWGGILI